MVRTQEPDVRLRNPHLYRTLRPEFVRTLDYPLCSDGFSRFVSGERDYAKYTQDIVRATEELKSGTIPVCSRTLDQVWSFWPHCLSRLCGCLAVL